MTSENAGVRSFEGEIGLEGNWWLIFTESYYNDVEIDNPDVVAFGNEHRIVMATPYAISPSADAARLQEMARSFGGRAAAEHPETMRDLGELQGNGWVGSWAIERLEGDEQQYHAFMAGSAPSYLVLVIRFRTQVGEYGAREIISSVFRES